MAGPREIAKAEAKKRADERRTAARQETLAIRQRVDADNAAANAELDAQRKAMAGPTENKDGQPKTTGLPAGQRRVVPVGTAGRTGDAGDTGNTGGALDSVAFASAAAKEAATAAGLTAADFSRKRKGSETGFNKADVERIAANRTADEGEG